MKWAAVISDHGLGEVPFAAYEDSELDAIFQSGRNGDTVSVEDENEIQNSYYGIPCSLLQRKRLGNATSLWSNS